MIILIIDCPTQGGVKPPPLGGGFSVSFVGCWDEQLSQRFPQCFFNSPTLGLENQVADATIERPFIPYWGRHMWARGYFCCSSGNVPDEVIKQYIAQQEDSDDTFRIKGE